MVTLAAIRFPWFASLRLIRLVVYPDLPKRTVDRPGDQLRPTIIWIPVEFFGNPKLQILNPFVKPFL